ncbi:hypothetical protein BDC45DRAFT_529556 [Circinella umbellata]|nr:hypothetical protein BDC45DRAFT_529556 [Circinella umbellata]
MLHRLPPLYLTRKIDCFTSITKNGSTQKLRHPLLINPVFKASAREFATNVLKEVVESLKNDSDEQIEAWAERYSKYNYQSNNQSIRGPRLPKEKYVATQKKRKTRRHKNNFSSGGIAVDILDSKYIGFSDPDDFSPSVLETTFTDEYWLSVSARSTEIMQRLVTEQQSQYKGSTFTERKICGNPEKKKNKTPQEQLQQWSSKKLQKQAESWILRLSQNNILNLIDHSNKGQKKIFRKKQWRELNNTYSITAERDWTSEELFHFITTLQPPQRLHAPLSYTILSLTIHTIWCHHWKYIFDRAPFRAGIIANIIDNKIRFFQRRIMEHEEVPVLTENDYVVRLWAPLLFALFEDCRKLNLTWGESVLRGVGDDSYYKVDLRVTFRHEKQNYVLSTGEFCKSANLGKMRADHVKLLLEGNMIIHNAKIHHINPEVSLLQCAGIQTLGKLVIRLNHEDFVESPI